MLGTQRKFAARGLTHSAAHHLLAVGEVIKQRGYARVADIARALGITPGSVSVTMQSLKSTGYIDQDENHFFTPTDKGCKAIASIRARHEVVERFLTELLCLPVDQAHRQSCRLEYLIEAATARRLSSLLDFWKKQHLQGALEVEDQCPECNTVEDELCPCCGLECLDDSCRLIKAAD